MLSFSSGHTLYQKITHDQHQLEKRFNEWVSFYKSEKEQYDKYAKALSFPKRGPIRLYFSAHS